MDYFWNTFLKSGSIEAYLGHKELERARKAEKAGTVKHSRGKKR